MLRLFNTLHHQLEDFAPIASGHVGVYSCGPTVYWNSHIGHMYAFTIWDIMVRFFRWSGLDVKHVMNLTDVGHLTTDADTGEDKMEKGAKREKLTVWQVAEKYTTQFFDSCDALNIKRPNVICRATDHITEMIDLIKIIEKNGYTYKIQDGIYFDTAKLKDYGEMANLSEVKLEEAARIEPVPGKKSQRDFALWKFSPKGVKRQMEWDSPWGVGFPGWHIECTAMSVKYLGKRFDIHTGGKEHIPVHHTNELAQGEGAYGAITANYWLHNNWLDLKGEKMSKSLGNVFTVQELKEKGFDPLAIRYLYLNSHYRQGVQFSLESLKASQNALNNLRSITLNLAEGKKENTAPTEESGKKRQQYFNSFKEAMSEDLNYPKALSVLWESVKSSLTSADKLDLIYEFDEVFGLNLREYATSRFSQKTIIPPEIQALAQKREELRRAKDFSAADEVRKQIEEKGYEVIDHAGKSEIKVKVES